MTSPTDTLLDFAEAWRNAPLPARVEDSTRQVVLDTLACYVGGASIEAGRILLAYAGQSRGDVTLYPMRNASPEAAAFAAASLANIIDSDDTLYNRGHHGCAIIMPSLIYGSLHGKTVRETLRAVAVGYEIAARISLSWSYFTIKEDGSVRGAEVTGLSWIAPGLAVSLGLLRGLGPDALRSAVGTVAYGAPLPTNSNWHLGYPLEMMTKYCLFGAIAQAAVSGVELAALGFVGPTHVMDGPHGFRRLMGATNCNDEVLSTGVPGTWTICETGLKRYPQGRIFHGALYGLESLATEHDIAPSNVKRVTVRLPMLHPSQVRLAGELPPLTQISAQFSVPYGCAQVIQRREPGPAWYAPSVPQGEHTLELMKKVDVVVDPDLHKQASEEVKRVGHYGFRLPWSVSIELASGQILSKSGTNAPGDPFVPELRISMPQTEEKFRRFYAQAFAKTAPEAVIGLLQDPNASCADLVNALGAA